MIGPLNVCKTLRGPNHERVGARPMADPIVQFNAGWVQLRREVRQLGARPVVRLRRCGDLSLSVDFVRQANIAECRFAAVFLSSDGYRLGLQFHDDERRPDSFLVGLDGGKRRGDVVRPRDNRVLQMSLSAKSPTVAALARQDVRCRTFTPRRDANGMWVIELAPCFENTFRLRGEFSAAETGIYRYVLNEETVYIGRGVLADRFSSKDRSDWQFTAIQYSILNNQDAEAKWETFWLDEFRTKFNRLPVYNRIGGARAAPSLMLERDAG